MSSFCSKKQLISKSRTHIGKKSETSYFEKPCPERLFWEIEKFNLIYEIHYETLEDY